MDDEANFGDLSEAPFRVYTIDTQGQPVLLGGADDCSLGSLLLDLHGKGSLTRIGIMHRPVVGETGEWLVKPWAAGP